MRTIKLKPRGLDQAFVSLANSGYDDDDQMFVAIECERNGWWYPIDAERFGRAVLRAAKAARKKMKMAKRMKASK